MRLLQKELASQNVSDYTIWNGIVDDVISCTGISRAHKQIVRYAKDSGLPRVLIAEDDLHFSAAGAFEYFIKSIPLEFDIYLGGISWGQIKDDNTVNDFSGTVFCVVHERFYDHFLSTREDKDLDRSLSGGGKFIVCQPMVVTQHSGFSDHHKKWLDLDGLFESVKLYGYQHIN